MNVTTFKYKLMESDCTTAMIFQKMSLPIINWKNKSKPQVIIYDVCKSYGSGIQELHRKNGSLLFHDIWALNWNDSQWLALEQLKLNLSQDGYASFTCLDLGPKG